MNDLQNINDSTQSLRDLSIINEISRSILSTLDYEKILQIISDGMSKLLEIETAAIYTINDDNDDEIFLSATTPALDPNMPDYLKKATLTEHPHIKRTIKEKKAIYIFNVSDVELTPEEKKVVELRNIRSLLYYPFITGENVIGVLILGTINKTKNYSNTQIELGQTVANHLSFAIQNSKLHYDLHEHKENLEYLVSERTGELENAYEELKLLNDELIKHNEIVLRQKDDIEKTMSHLKTVQSQLIQSEKMATLGILTAGVAHEINNPLNYIIGAYYGLDDYINEQMDNKDEPLAYLESIKEGVGKIAKIVKGLHHFSNNNEELNDDCNMNTIINNCLVMLKNKLNENIKIVTNFNDDDAHFSGNLGKLHQAILNILNNSVEAIKNEGEISINSEADENSIYLSITDNGPGIKKEYLNMITDPFFTTKEPGEGTGLGLYIAFNIIKEHNGKMDFESEVGKGTKIRISLPNK